MRILGIDLGFQTGHGLVQYDGPIICGTKSIPGSCRQFGIATAAFRTHVTGLITTLKPDLVICAEPWIRRHPPVTVDALRPIIGFGTIVEMLCLDMKVEYVEENEGRVRGYFMDPVPRGTDAIKAAVEQACRDRLWAIPDHHAGDALLMAAYALAVREPDRQHELLPLYQKRKRAA